MPPARVTARIVGASFAAAAACLSLHAQPAPAASAAVVPFKISVPDAALKDL